MFQSLNNIIPSLKIGNWKFAFSLQRKSVGFTLLELLVVISIIGLIATSAMAIVQEARKKGEDAVKKVELSEVSKALEMYYDKYNTYQIIGGGWVKPEPSSMAECEEFQREDADPRSEGQGNGFLMEKGCVDNRFYDKDYSILEILYNEGFISTDKIFPYSIEGLLYTCEDDKRYTLYAKLKNPSSADLATMNNDSLLCNGAQVKSWGYNFAIYN